MKAITLVTFAVIFNLINLQSINAQVTQEWVRNYDGGSQDEAWAMALDNSGNVYITGVTGSNYATIKYNSLGIQQWVSIYNGPANGYDIAKSIAVDDSGNVFVTGLSPGIGSGNGYATIKYNSAGDSVWVKRIINRIANPSLTIDSSGNVYVAGNDIVKYNSLGVQQWSRSFSIGTSIKVDNSGNVYVAGYTSSSNGNYLTGKYNSSGILQWTKTYNGPGNSHDEAHSLAIDDSGNVYVTGQSRGSGSDYDYATIKYNSLGVEQWVQRYNGPANSTDLASSMDVDNSGNVFVTGKSKAINSFYHDYVTIKYNPLGIEQWMQRYNSIYNSEDYAHSLDVDNLGNVYVTGQSNTAGSDWDYSTIKYNSSGVEQWVQRYNGPNFVEDRARCIKVDNSGNVFVTGRAGDSYNYTTIKYSQQSPKTLQLTSLIEGFYNIVTNKMIPDTARVYLRNAGSPYAIVDSAKSVLDSNGNRTLNFYLVSNGIPYYIVVKHRNSIETWSGAGQSFTSNSLTYNFTTSSSQAYGNNMVLKATKYCIYSGDVNQEGTVDATDLSLIDNAAFNFVTGYVSTDVDGNDFVDASDAAIANNNAFNFVSVIRP